MEFCKWSSILLSILVNTHGSILIIVGALILTDDKKFDSKPLTSISMGCAAVTIGVLVNLLSLLGCYGVYKQKRRILCAYSAVLVVLGLTQFGLGVKTALVVVHHDHSQRVIDNTLKTFFKESTHRFKGTKQAKEIVDSIQHYYKCCGYDMPSWWEVKPPSCYADSSQTNDNLFKIGCQDVVKWAVLHKVSIFVGTSIVFGIFWIVTAIWVLIEVCWITKQINNGKIKR